VKTGAHFTLLSLVLLTNLSRCSRVNLRLLKNNTSVAYFDEAPPTSLKASVTWTRSLSSSDEISDREPESRYNHAAREVSIEIDGSLGTQVEI
jgi:hypothetical protein